MLLVKWLASCNRPFLIVEDAPLRQLCEYLHADAALPSARTASRDVQIAYDCAKELIRARFGKHDGAVSLSVDGWGAPNLYHWLGIYMHWIETGRHRKLLLDMVEQRGAHTGKNMAQDIKAVMEDYGLSDKVCLLSLLPGHSNWHQLLAITMDNASNNDTLVTELDHLIDGFAGSEVRVRCAAHILNLVVNVSAFLIALAFSLPYRP
jgi:hypothetical protein